MREIIRDFRFAFRALLRRSALSAAAALTLALGIGATSALFTVVDGVLLKPLPYEDPDRLMVIRETHAGKDVASARVAPAKLVFWREEARSFTAMVAARPVRLNLTGGGEPEEVDAHEVSAEYFRVLGIPLLRGREFDPAEATSGRHRVAVISHGLWQRRFGADPEVLERQLRLNGELYQVIGVAAAVRDPLGEPELWAPLENVVWTSRVSHSLEVLARLAPGVSVKQARAELDELARRQEREHPATDAGWRVRLSPLAEEIVGGVRRALLVLFAAVGFVLLIACANVATLLLARSFSRRKEIATRMALGSGRSAVLRLLLTESLALALVGGGVGLGLAFLGVRLFLALAPADLPRLAGIGVDVEAVGFALVATVVAGALSGLLPVVQAWRSSFSEILREAGRGGGVGRHLQRLFARLMVAEVALALVLLIGAGLMVKSFLRLQRVDPGFDPARVLAVDLPLSQAGYQRAHERVEICRELLERASALPGVVAAGFVSRLPLAGAGATFRFLLENHGGLSLAEQPEVEVRAVSHGYFRTLAIPLREGKSFDEWSGEGDTPAIVNEAMARRFWPDEPSAGGQRISIEGPEGPWLPILGIVGNVRHFGLGREAPPELYLPVARLPWPAMTLVVRTSGDPRQRIPEIKAAIRDIDPDLPAASIRTLDDLVAASLARPRFQLTLLGLFAVLALVLTALGLYGTMAYAVELRSQEMGIRMSLGADRRSILALVLGQALRLSLVGVVLGLTAAAGLTRLLGSLLYEVDAMDPAVFVLVSLLLTAVVLAAAYLPARRATRIAPAMALRELGAG